MYPEQPYHPPVPPAPSSPASPAKSRAGVIAGIVAGSVVLLGVGATAGTHAYAKHSICTAMEGNSPLAGNESSSGDQPDVTQIREAADGLRSYGRMLFFDSDLKSAVSGLAEDVDQMADLTNAPSNDAAVFAELITIAGSVNTHARQAQRACGLPVTGIFDG